ncbi:hypothetical protein AF332_03875 [Sporosarcina globispora]|uniref:Uncharacterized protein n=1 Tax=Sporosarcina globispora TaxID=1459 RepID=A0A0M0G942_SPOGL|nr:hypothetical protein AF332_03875 [Sporosarcina globispora]
MNDKSGRINSVFWVSAVVITFLVLLGAIGPNLFASAAAKAFDFTTYAFGWFYFISVLFLSYSVSFWLSVNLAASSLGMMKIKRIIHFSHGSGCYLAQVLELDWFSGELPSQ